MHPTAVHFADYRFARGTDDEFFFKFGIADVRDESDFGSESFDVLRLSQKIAVRYEHGEIGVFVSRLFKTAVELVLNVFPYFISVRTNDHSSLYRAVVYKLRL